VQRLLFYLAALGAGVVGLMLLIPILGFIFLLLVAVIAFLLLMPLLARLPWFRNWIRVEHLNGRRVMRFGRDGFMGYREQSKYRQTWDVHEQRSDDDVIDVVPQIKSSTNDDDEETPTK
jgi:hypothetical protein